MSDLRTLDELRDEIRTLLPILRAEYQVNSIALFGSYVRQTQGQNSDLDLLVEFVETPGLLKFLRIENLLSDKLGVNVDLVMKSALKPGIGKRILEEAVAI